MGSLDLALSTVRDAIEATLTSANLIREPGQVIVGWPNGQELHEIAHQPGAGAQVSVWPLDNGKPDPRYHDTTTIASGPSAGTTATLDSTGHLLTIAGAPKAGDVVHAFFGHPTADAFHLVVAGDTPASIASAIAAAANALAVPGVTASVLGDVVTLSNAWFSRVNVGGTATLIREINRICDQVQVSIWAPNAQMRSDIQKAITESLGGTDQPFLAMSDGTGLRIAYSHPKWWDKAQQAYSIYRCDLIFDIEFGITKTIVGTQVEGTSMTVQVNSSAPVTTISGG